MPNLILFATIVAQFVNIWNTISNFISEIYDILDNIKNICTDKAYKKSCPVIHTYNDGKQNLMLLLYSLIILGFS